MHPIHSMFGSRVCGKGGSNGAISDSIKSKMAADGHTKMAITSQFATGLPIDVLFGSRVGFSGRPN